MASHIDKKITLISGAGDVKIKNSQSNFQNYLQDRFYLDQSTRPLGLCLSSISVDLKFKSPLCSIDENYPQFIVTTVKDFTKDRNVSILPIIVTKDVIMSETKSFHQIQQKNGLSKKMIIMKIHFLFSILQTKNSISNHIIDAH